MLAKSRLTAKPLIQMRSPWAGTALMSLSAGTGALQSCVYTCQLAQYMGSIGLLCPFWNCPLLIFLLSGGLLQPFKYLASELNWCWIQALWKPRAHGDCTVVSGACMMKLVKYFSVLLYMYQVCP